jgi:hypothetical protein
MRSFIFGILLTMAGMAGALVFVGGSDQNPSRVFVPETLSVATVQ